MYFNSNYNSVHRFDSYNQQRHHTLIQQGYNLSWIHKADNNTC